jgi:hypothetical protein
MSRCCFCAARQATGCRIDGTAVFFSSASQVLTKASKSSLIQAESKFLYSVVSNEMISGDCFKSNDHFSDLLGVGMYCSKQHDATNQPHGTMTLDTPSRS